MRELLGRLTALDPEATESLRVITYFDELTAARAGVEVLLRGAAVLAGCPSGFAADERPPLRVAPDGARLSPSSPDGWPLHPAGRGASVWLEREGRPHANDAMVLERLAIGVAVALSRSVPEARLQQAVEALLDGARPDEERQAAAARLRLAPHRPLVAVALPAGAAATEAHPTAILSTPFGLARAELAPAPSRGEWARAGIGSAVEPLRLPDSWRAALVALRLTDERSPVVEAEALGTLLLLAEAADRLAEPPPDVAALNGLPGAWALATLEAFSEAGSTRGAAATLGVHHSTVQARMETLATRLGYDPRPAPGRLRLTLALRLHRLLSTRL